TWSPAATAVPSTGAATNQAAKPATTPTRAIQPQDRVGMAGLVRQVQLSSCPARYARSSASSASAVWSSESNACMACTAASQAAHVRTWAATAAASAEGNASASHRSRVSSSGQAIGCYSLCFEVAAQPRASAQQRHANAVDALLGQLGDVGIGQVGEIAQHDHHPLRLGESVHRVADDGAALAARDDLAGIGLALDLLELQFGRGSAAGLGGFAAATAQLVQRLVGRDTQEPGAQRAGLVEAREVLVGFEKRAIAHLGGYLPVVHEAQHGAEHGRLVRLDQRREGRFVAGAALVSE